MAYFTDLKQIFQKLIWNQKRPQRAMAILRHKNKVGGNTKTDIKVHYKANVIKKAWDWHKYRCVDQWNRMENPEINASLYSELIFEKVGKSIQWDKDSPFNKCCWENWTGTCKK